MGLIEIATYLTSAIHQSICNVAKTTLRAKKVRNNVQFKQEAKLLHFMILILMDDSAILLFQISFYYVLQLFKCETL